jgi:hypothetical protein
MSQNQGQQSGQSQGGTATMGQAVHPKTGERYACAKCGVEMEVRQSCDCKNPCAHLDCCGQPMQKR